MEMTKREKYDAMKKDGAKLRAFNTLRTEEVDELYRERFGENQVIVQENKVATPPAVRNFRTAQKEDGRGVVLEQNHGNGETKKIPPLYFDHGGWCNELGRSFFKGYYRPASWKEYQYLLPHATRGEK